MELSPNQRYVAVIFSSRRTGHGAADYDAAAVEMEALAERQPGFLGIESARNADGTGITVSYWATVAHAQAWKGVAEHRAVQQRGRDEWYESYRVRIAEVTRDYSHP